MNPEMGDERDATAEEERRLTAPVHQTPPDDADEIEDEQIAW